MKELSTTTTTSTTSSSTSSPHDSRRYALKCSFLHPITLWQWNVSSTMQDTKQKPNDNSILTNTNCDTCTSVGGIIIMRSLYTSIMVATTLLLIVGVLAGVVPHGISSPWSVDGGIIEAFTLSPLKNVFHIKNSSLSFVSRSSTHNTDTESTKMDQGGKDVSATNHCYKRLEDDQTVIDIDGDDHDETENDRYGVYHQHHFRLNDSLLCDPTSKESNCQSLPVNYLGCDSIKDNDSDNDNNSSILYMNETNYNLLKNITTSVGSFQPLPLPTPLSVQSACTIQQHAVRMMTKPKRFIPVLEARGSSDRDIDKNEFGHRRDTIPIAEAIDDLVIPAIDNDDNDNDSGVKTAVLQFLEDDNGQNQYAVHSNLALKNYLTEVAHGIVVRINPGTLSPLAQKKCDDMLRELSNEGVIILTHPDVSSTLGAKDSLVKIKNLSCGMKDTEVYYDPDSFQRGFRKSIAFQPRVIKQNRGSQGEGVWIVKLKDEGAYCDTYGECMVEDDTELILMEAFDNHVEHHTVKEFIDFCVHGRRAGSDTEWTSTSGGAYFDGGLASGAMVVDQRFLPRIVEGEVRCLMVGSELVEILHKKPIEGGLSATLQSGAIYTKYAPDHPKFAKLVKNFKDDVPHIMKSFGMSDRPLPLLWTVDYIYGDTDDDLYAGEINCSCPGITSQLHIAPTIAKAAFESIFVRR